jgi:hypothetical protein
VSAPSDAGPEAPDDTDEPIVHRIEDVTPFEATGRVIMAVIGFGAALGIVAAYHDSLELDVRSPSFNPAIFVPAILALYGVWQAFQALRARRIARRFGRSVFEMQGRATHMGETLRGRILTSFRERPDDGFTVRLRAVEAVRIEETGSERGARYEDRIRHESVAHVVAPAPSVEGIPVTFEVPKVRAKGSLRFALDVAATVNGASYTAVFSIPAWEAPDPEEEEEAT